MEDIEHQFINWHADSEEAVEQLFDMLSNQLSDEPEALIRDLAAVEAWNARAIYLLAQADTFLDQAMEYYRLRIEGGTALDKKVKLDSDTSPMRKVRDQIQGLVDSIKQRLILGESILAYQRAYAGRSGKEKIEKIY